MKSLTFSVERSLEDDKYKIHLYLGSIRIEVGDLNDFQDVIESLTTMKGEIKESYARELAYEEK